MKEYEWKIETKAPVFASPFFCSTLDVNNVLENRLYAVDIDGNFINIKLKISPSIVGSSFSSTINRSKSIKEEDSEEIHINKKLRFNRKDNNIKNNYTEIETLNNIKLSGPIFSSPFVLNNNILVIGSRDDNLYVLD